MSKTYECPYCGDIFTATLIKGDPEMRPPCADCAFDGFRPQTQQDIINDLIDGEL